MMCILIQLLRSLFNIFLNKNTIIVNKNRGFFDVSPILMNIDSFSLKSHHLVYSSLMTLVMREWSIKKSIKHL